MIERSRATICTPTYLLSRDNPKMARLTGLMLFVMMVFCLVFLTCGLFYIYGSPMLDWIKNLVLAAFGSAIFLVLVCLFLVDTLSSIDDHLAQIAKSHKQSEEHLYAMLLLLGRKAKEENSVKS